MSDMTREEVERLLDEPAGIRSSIEAVRACEAVLAHDTAQRATIAEQAERIARLELELEAWQRADSSPTETLHDKYTMAALTGLLAKPGTSVLDYSETVRLVRFHADEAMKQREKRP